MRSILTKLAMAAFVLLVLLQVFAAAAFGQVVGLQPTPMAGYTWDPSTNQWDKQTTTDTANPAQNAPQAFAWYRFNATLGQWVPCQTGEACMGSGGGTTTNPLTAAASGGAAPGSTFNGSSPVTFDFHSFGAAGINGTPVAGNCTDWFSANVLGDAGAPCGTGSATTVDILSNQRASGTFILYPRIEWFGATAGTPVTIFSATGAGYISNIFVAQTGANLTAGAGLLSCSVNGESSPSFSGLLRDIYEYTNNTDPNFGNYFISVSAGVMSGFFTVPIPFNNGITCTLTPEITGTLWVYVTAHATPDTWPYTRKLHTFQIESATPTSTIGATYVPNSYETLVNWTGPNPGRLVGVYMMNDGNATSTNAELEGDVVIYTDVFNYVWTASGVIGSGVTDTILDPNANFQTTTGPCTLGTTEPTFTSATVSGRTTADGTCTWTAAVGTPLNIWRPSSPYVVGMSLIDQIGNVETVTTAGTVGATEPTFCTTAGCTTTTNGVVFTMSLASTMVLADMIATGTEDFFGLGFYFNTASTSIQGTNGQNGTTLNASNRYGAYKFFVDDPIRFNHSIGIIRQVGDISQASAQSNTLQSAFTMWYTQDTN